MSRGPMNVIYLGEAALMVAVPADLLRDLVDSAEHLAYAVQMGVASQDDALDVEMCVAAIEQLEGS